MIMEFSEEEKKSNEFIRSIRTKTDELNLYIETGTDGTDAKRLSRDLHFSQNIGSKIMRITVELDKYSRNFTVERHEIKPSHLTPSQPVRAMLFFENRTRSLII